MRTSVELINLAAQAQGAHPFLKKCALKTLRAMREFINKVPGINDCSTCRLNDDCSRPQGGCRSYEDYKRE